MQTNTILKKLRPDTPEENASAITLGAEILKKGGLVAFPTETVYGLGANALNPEACEKIYKAKGRPGDNPLIVHISEKAQLSAVAEAISPAAEKLIAAFWPGPLTVVLKKKPIIPAVVSGGLPTVAVRLPENETARLLIEKAGFPIAAPSANASGRPSPTTAAHVAADLTGKIDMILDGGDATLGLESTVVDAQGDCPVILRPGSITPAMIKTVCGSVAIDPAVNAMPGEGYVPSAPGQKYRHYAPKAKLTLFIGDKDKITAEINRRLFNEPPEKTGVLCTDGTKDKYSSGIVLSLGDEKNPAEIGANLFKILRAFDALGVQKIFGEGFPDEKEFFAVMNRLKKAAGYHIIDLKQY